MLGFKKVIKSTGHCTDGCGWTPCGFWETKNINTEYRSDVCTLFNDVEKPESYSLEICNRIYGQNYDGVP